MITSIPKSRVPHAVSVLLSQMVKYESYQEYDPEADIKYLYVNRYDPKINRERVYIEANMGHAVFSSEVEVDVGDLLGTIRNVGMAFSEMIERACSGVAI